LAAVSLQPFPTRAFAEHVKVRSGSPDSNAVLDVEESYAANHPLFDSRLSDRHLQRGKRDYLVTTGILAIAAIVTAFEWRLG
jgi:hypothetical protein